MLPKTEQLLRSALALPREERRQLIDALIAADPGSRADRVLVAALIDERCLESCPCQHSWTFAVERVLKGDAAANELRIFGRYTDHAAIPGPLRTAVSGKCILFLQAGNSDTSILAAVPWSAEAEAELSRHSAQGGGT